MKAPRIRRRGWWWKKPSSCFLSSGSEERNLIFRFFLKFDPDKWCISFKKMKTSPTHHQKRGGERLWTISGRFGRGSFGEGLDEISLWCRDEEEEEGHVNIELLWFFSIVFIPPKNAPAFYPLLICHSTILLSSPPLVNWMKFEHPPPSPFLSSSDPISAVCLVATSKVDESLLVCNLVVAR